MFLRAGPSGLALSAGWGHSGLNQAAPVLETTGMPPQINE